MLSGRILDIFGDQPTGLADRLDVGVRETSGWLHRTEKSPLRAAGSVCGDMRVGHVGWSVGTVPGCLGEPVHVREAWVPGGDEKLGAIAGEVLQFLLLLSWPCALGAGARGPRG